MSQRQEFIRLYLTRRHTVAELCCAFGISEKTGYKWLARFKANGTDGLADRSHAPHRPAQQLEREVVERILALRRKRPTWGAKKLRRHLHTLDPLVRWPAASTIGALLHRAGLIRPRRRRRERAWYPLDQLLTTATAPNEVWTTDFKGEFRLGSGRYCYPLTVMDSHSRFLLGCTALHSTAHAPTKAVFTRLFRTYGLPHVIRSDNGVPFASPMALGRLSPLAVWWIRLGIRPERITPGRPQENASHERMHRTLKDETTRPPAADLRAQQRRFTEFQLDFNTVRPHESLNQEPPATQYAPSPRRLPRTLHEIAYPAHLELRRVDSTGYIKWHRHRIWLTGSLGGEYVSLEETAADCWTIAFASLHLGTYDAIANSFTPSVYWIDRGDHTAAP